MRKIIHLDENHKLLKDELEKLGFKNYFDLKSNKKEIEKKISKYQGIILRSRIEIDKKFIDSCKNLKFIARVGSGLENIDTDYAKKKNIEIISAAEANANAVGEHAIGMLLTLLNKIIKSNNEIKHNIWAREQNRGIELDGKTIGIIGYGNTGKSLAKKLSGFSVRILCNDIIEEVSDKYATQVSINEIMKRCDIISLHTNLNDSSFQLINKDFINNCKKPFFLINTSRGECLKTSDIVDGIKTGKILGACLDVIENESKSFDYLKTNSDFEYLKKSEKVILTPHVAGWSIESKLKLAQVVLEKIKVLYEK